MVSEFNGEATLGPAYSEIFLRLLRPDGGKDRFYAFYSEAYAVERSDPGGLSKMQMMFRTKLR